MTDELETKVEMHAPGDGDRCMTCDARRAVAVVIVYDFREGRGLQGAQYFCGNCMAILMAFAKDPIAVTTKLAERCVSAWNKEQN